MSLAPKIDAVLKPLEKQVSSVYTYKGTVWLEPYSITTNEPEPCPEVLAQRKGERAQLPNCSLLSQWPLTIAFVTQALELGAGLRPYRQQSGDKTM